MNSKERMLAVLNNQPVDYIPCSFMLFFNLYNQCKSEFEYITKEVELGIDPFVHVGHFNHTMHLTGTLHPEAKYSEWTEVEAGVKYFCRRIDTPKGPLTSRIKQWDGWPTEGDFPLFKDWLVPRADEYLVKPEQDIEKIKYLFGPFKDADIAKLKEEARGAKQMAEKYGLPVVSLIDTPGAYPGVGAEERGQAQAIAVNLLELSRLRVPIICIVIGEGGSGGALGIGVGDKLAMLEFAYYSVISPEGCAAILWRDGSQAADAAEALKLTSTDLYKLGLVDEVISEPLGGAHRNIHDTVYNVEKYVIKTLAELKRIKTEELLDARYKKLRSIGVTTAEVIRRKTEDARRRIKAAIEAIPTAKRPVPATPLSE